MDTTRVTRQPPFPQEPLTLRRLASNGAEQFMRFVFSMTRQGGTTRFTIFILGGLVVWIILATHEHGLLYWREVWTAVGDCVLFFTQPDPISAALFGVVELAVYLFQALADLVSKMFAPEVFRHVVAITLPVFIALRIATTYLTDIFELEKERIAFRFIAQASFGLQYSRVVITDNKVTPDDSPVLKIGGPGYVQVNLENVAVFDRSNGQSHLIGPTATQPNRAVLIESFERFREAIDLRDQITEREGLEINGRTRDGIRITAKDMRMIFSVLRDPLGNKLDASDRNPNALTFSESAIWRLVYNRVYADREEPWVNVMKDLVHRSMQYFIKTHELSWFLAAADVPEFRNEPGEADPADGASFLNLGRNPTINRTMDYPVRTESGAFTFTTRPAITRLFHTPDFKRDTNNLGTQLDWIDVGTWSTTAAVIPEHHLEAWKISSSNQLRRKNITVQEKEGRVEELLGMIRDVPLIAFRQVRNANKSDLEIQRELLAKYIQMLRSAHTSYINEGVLPPPELAGAINYLEDFLK